MTEPEQRKTWQEQVDEEKAERKAEQRQWDAERALLNEELREYRREAVADQKRMVEAMEQIAATLDNWWRCEMEKRRG